jgi:hypothetical protein
LDRPLVVRLCANDFSPLFCHFSHATVICIGELNQFGIPSKDTIS